MNTAQAEVHAGAWKLEKNDVWNVPDGVTEVRFDIETLKSGWRLITKIKGLVLSRKGIVYGIRSLNKPVSEGHAMFGRVSIGGKKVLVFTSSKLFERPDGSLVDVAVMFVS